MLLFDDSKRLEKALGEEAATVIAHVFEKADEKWRRDLATKADLAIMEARIIKWVAGLLIAQAALVAALVKLL